MVWRMVHPHSSLIVNVPEEEDAKPAKAKESEAVPEKSIEDHPGRMNRAFTNLSKKARGVLTRGTGEPEL